MRSVLGWATFRPDQPSGSTGGPQPRPSVQRFPSFGASRRVGIRPEFRSPRRTANIEAEQTLHIVRLGQEASRRFRTGNGAR